MRHVWRSFPWQVTPSCALGASMIHSLRSDLLQPVRNAGNSAVRRNPNLPWCGVQEMQSPEKTYTEQVSQCLNATKGENAGGPGDVS